MEETLYTLALKYLSLRSRSEKEIHDYLVEKMKKRSSGDFASEEMEIIEHVLQKLRTKKFIDDINFACLFIRSKVLHNPKSKKIISLELLQKGVSKEDIEKAFVSEEENLPGDLENAVKILEKEKRKYVLLQKHIRFQKAGAMLTRRGFDIDVIRHAIDSVFGK